MAKDSQIGLRTISRCQIFRQVTIPGATANDPATLALLPIPSIVAPTQAVINLNQDVADLSDVNCKGEQVIAFSYVQGFKPELELEFSTGAPEMDSLIHGRIIGNQNNFPGFVFFEADTIPGQTAIAPRLASQAGYEVATLTAITGTSAQIYYTDPDTKLHKKITVVDSSPTGDQVVITQHLAITLSTALADKNISLRGWIPCVFPKATVITGENIGLLTVYAMGVSFDQKFAGLIARNCSRLPQGNLGSDPKKQVKLRILPDPNDGNGLGFQMYYTNKEMVC